MWLDTQVNFLFARSFARFLELCKTFGGEMPTFVNSTIKQEFSILFAEILKQNVITSTVALANSKNTFSTLMEVANQFGYGWFEVINYDEIKKEISIHLVDSLWPHVLGPTGQAVCEFISPVIAAAAEVAHKKQCEVIQETCTSTFEPTCSFQVTVSNDPWDERDQSIKRLPGGLPIQDITRLSRNITFTENGWFYFFGHPLVLLPSTLLPKLQYRLLSRPKEIKEILKEINKIFYHDTAKVMQNIIESPKIAHGLRANQEVQKTAASLLEECSKLGWGRAQTELMVFNEINREYHVVLANSVIPENYPVLIDEPVCHVFNATFAALVGVLHDQAYLGKEILCQSLGDTTCEFHLIPNTT